MSYDKSFLSLVEMVYGKGFLSQGSSYVLEQMFQGIDLENKDMLDIGSGLGGIDFLLAENFNVRVVGVDPLEEAVQQAKDAYEQKKSMLKGTVTFQVLPADKMTSLAMFADNSFDVVFSRETLLHVPVEQKRAYFKEMFRVLKPSGFIVVVDWTHSTPNYSNEFKKMMAMDDVSFNLVSPKEYEENLKQAGFSSIEFKDDTAKYVELSSENCASIRRLKDKIEKEFDAETYKNSLKSWEIQQKIFERKEVIIANFRARKRV